VCWGQRIHRDVGFVREGRVVVVMSYAAFVTVISGIGGGITGALVAVW